MKTIYVAAAVIVDQGRIFTACRGYGEFKGCWEFPGGKIEKDEKTEDALQREIKEELAAEEPSVIISRRPCALLKYVKHEAPLAVDEDACIGCESCMGIGCPAISMREGQAHVDATLCVGCGVCAQLCPVDAFSSTGEGV